VVKKFDCSVVKVDSPDYKRQLSNGLYYAHYELSSKDLAKAVVKYAKTDKDLKKYPFSVLPDYSYNVVGKYCYILNNGGEIDEVTFSKIKKMIIDIGVKAKEAAKQKAEKTAQTQQKNDTGPVLTIQDRLRMRAEEVAGEHFEAEVDKLIQNPKAYSVKDFNPASIMHTEELKQGHLRYVVKFYEPHIAELNEYLNGDEYAVESYDYLGKSGVKKLIKLYQSIIDSAKMIIKSAKANKPTRRKKSTPLSKQVEKLRYCKTDKNLKIASVNPTEIVGAKIVWAYNTKARKIIRYQAQDESGISVKGTTLVNIAEASRQKTLRKPEEQIKLFKGTKRSWENAFKSIKSIDTKVTPRFNENIVILKVFK